MVCVVFGKKCAAVSATLIPQCASEEGVLCDFLIHYSITMANVTKEERRGQKEEKKVEKVIMASGNYNN